MSVGRAVLLLAWARWLVARNNVLRGNIWQRLAALFLLLVSLSGMFVGYTISWGIVQLLRSPEFIDLLREAAAQNPAIPTDTSVWLQAVPGSVLFLASLMLVFSSFSSVLSSLYLSGDMDMLLARPVPLRAVFIVKFFDGLLTQYFLLLVLLLPALLGYGMGMGYLWPYFIGALLVLLLLPLLPTGLAALLVMLVVRVLPAHRAREIVGILGVLVAVLLFVLTQFAPEIAPNVATIDNIDALLTLNLPILPSAWAGRALTAAGEGALLTMLVYGSLFVLLSLLVFAGCLLLAERMYYAGWSNMAAQGGKPRRRAGWLLRPASSGMRRGSLTDRWAAYEPQSAAVFRKDWRAFLRDLRNIQQLIFPLALSGIWVARLLLLPQEPESRAMLGMLNGSIAFFLCLSASSAIAGPGISREGRGLWLLKIAPISPLRILLGKLLLSYLPYPFFGTLLLLLLTLLGGSDTPLLDFFTGWGMLLLLGLGTSALALGLGAIFPRITWDNPRQQSTFLAGCISSMLLPMYISTVLIIVLGLQTLAAVLADISIILALLLGIAAWLLGLLITALVVGAVLTLAAHRFQRLEL